METISSSNWGSSVIGMDVDVDVSRPFAMVDEITEESPAADDGLQLGDQIVKFGNVEYSDNLLSKLASEAQMNQGRPVTMLVMRQGTLITMTVTPRTWRGRGLLGYVTFFFSFFCKVICFPTIALYLVFCCKQNIILMKMC